MRWKGVVAHIVMEGFLYLQADDSLYMLDFVGPPGFAVAAAKVAGRYPTPSPLFKPRTYHC